VDDKDDRLHHGRNQIPRLGLIHPLDRRDSVEEVLADISAVGLLIRCKSPFKRLVIYPQDSGHRAIYLHFTDSLRSAPGDCPHRGVLLAWSPSSTTIG
jgi:hypothetical protein